MLCGAIWRLAALQQRLRQPSQRGHCSDARLNVPPRPRFQGSLRSTHTTMGTGTGKRARARRQ
jgi:hypothetical protein